MPASCATPLAARIQREICNETKPESEIEPRSNGQITTVTRYSHT